MPTNKNIKSEYEIKLLDNSIERVINTTIKILIHSNHEDADMNIRDWEEMKSTAVQVWNAARNEVFKKYNP
jgi:hypothetical protein